MPELPEVETICRQLNRELHGGKIESIEILKSGHLQPEAVKFKKLISGKSIIQIKRRAKLIIWKLSGGLNIVTHLKMTGRLVIVDLNYKPQKHDRIIFSIGHKKLVWSDMRQFGFMYAVKQNELPKLLAHYGPEPLDIKAADLAKLFIEPKTRNVKSALLNQKVIAGIGNIYADEALFRAHIRPTRHLGDLTDTERINLAKSIQAVLKQSIAKQGTSSRNYVNASGQPGKFAAYLNVYGRENLSCKKCSAKIQRIVVAQRGTHYCPKCQK